MSLFGKRKNEKAESCCKNTASDAKTTAGDKEPVYSTENKASVKVLGSGCAKCNTLEAVTKEALAELGMDTAIDHITDFAQIAAYGVMSTPALVVDGKVVLYGRVPNKEAVVTILKKVRG